MTPGATLPTDDLLAETRADDDEPEVGCYVVEGAWVPILTEPSHEGQEVGYLRRGELVICERASSDNRNQWVRLPPATEIYSIPRLGRRRRRAGKIDGSGSEGEGCGSEGEGSESEGDGEEDDAKSAVRKSGEGGYVVCQHCVLGPLLRHVGPPPSAEELAAPELPRDLSQREIDEVLASTRNNEDLEEEVELPVEAKVWTKEQLETFIVHGTRPRWRSVPEKQDLGLSGTLSPDQVEEALRTAVEWISRADALLVSCGAGMAADSGLPTLQGWSRGPHAWKGLRKHGLRFEDMCDARWFTEDPRLAWGFWLHVCKTCRDAELHGGYELVKGWMERAAAGGFAFTSTFDSHWAACGWPTDRLIERHGALHLLQCSGPCCDETWHLPDQLGLTEDPETFRAEGELPTCPRCGSVARPNVEMFGDDHAWKGAQQWEQWGHYEAWSRGLSDERFDKPTVVCLELGCSPGSSSRRFLEEQLESFGNRGRHIRVNPQHMAVAAWGEGQAVALPLRAWEALVRMERLHSVVPMTSFICQDAYGQGAEIVARSDAGAGHVVRRALAESPKAEAVGELFVKAQNVLNEREEKDQPFDSPVPASMQVVARDNDLPAVRLNIHGINFKSRNARMQARLEAVKRMLGDLLEAYGAEAYQAKIEAATDRSVVVNLVREVHFKVLPNHGISMSVEAGSGETAKRVLGMQAFLQSGKLEEEIGHSLGYSVYLSGYSRLASLPAAKPKAMVAPSNARAIVVADAGKQAGAESKWASSYRPPKVLWIASTWNKWSPKEMKWDGSRFVEDVTVGKTGWESFQVLVMGRWEAALYPSVRDGNPYVEYKLLGPDSKGHGRNFTIGRHPRDTMRPGDRLKVAVDVDAKGAARKVSWKLEDGQATGGRFVPQLNGLQLLAKEEQIIGNWQYGTKPNIYRISKAKDGIFRFDGPHAGGRVTGELKAEGLWIQANLVNASGVLVGTIRLSYLKDDDTMISNFRNASKQEWGKDIAARRSQQESQ